MNELNKEKNGKSHFLRCQFFQWGFPIKYITRFRDLTFSRGPFFANPCYSTFSGHAKVHYLGFQHKQMADPLSCTDKRKIGK